MQPTTGRLLNSGRKTNMYIWVHDNGKQRQRPESTGGDDLLTDVLFHILSCLPAKSLLRFRCVSSRWRDIIDHPHLAAMQVERGAEEPSLFALTHPSPRRTTLRGLKEDGNSLSPFREPPMAELETTERLDCYTLEGSCHGLLCFVRRAAALSLVFNPLRAAAIHAPPKAPTASLAPCLASYGLGFHRAANVYKLLRVFPREVEATTGNWVFGAELHALGTSAWKHIGGVPHNFPPGPSVFASGALHWADPAGVGIISFDVGGERFRWAGAPVKTTAFHLVGLRGCLAMVDLSSDAGIGIWVWTEGEQGGWAQEHFVRMRAPLGTYDNSGVKVLGTWEGDKMLVTMSNRQYFSWDPRNDGLRYIDNLKSIDDDDQEWSSREVFCHTLSLMSVCNFSARV